MLRSGKYKGLIFGVGYTAVYLPLTDVNNKIIGMIFTRDSSRLIDTLIVETTARIGQISSFSIAFLIFFTALIIKKYVNKPLKNLLFILKKLLRERVI